ncbi:hypothetical protein [Nocardia asteroides]
MPTPGFTLTHGANSADFGASSPLVPTDDAALTGTVFTEMGEHIVAVDGVPVRRSMVIVRLFNLRAFGEVLGNPAIAVRFVPGAPRHGAAAMVCLGEHGGLYPDLGQCLDSVAVDLRNLVTDTALAITAEYLTDDRAARYRHHCAEQRRQDAANALTALDLLQQHGSRRLAAARADTDAAWALVQALGLHQQH